MKLRLLTAVLAALALASCSVQETETAPAAQGKKTVTFDFGISGYTATKSRLGDGFDDEAIHDVLVAAFDENGNLEAMTRGSSLELNAQYTHVLYALANFGDGIEELIPSREEEMEQLRCRIPSYGALRGIPMSATTDIDEGETSCHFVFRRLMAKVTLRIDDTNLVDGIPGIGDYYRSRKLADPDFLTGHFKAWVRQTNAVLLPFNISKASASDDLLDGPGDGAPEEGDFHFDFNRDGQAVLYIPENDHGVLLPGNSDPYAKHFGTGSGPDDVGSLCTYILVEVPQDAEQYGVGGVIRYRFYLGSDTTTDFSVKGGRSYSVSLALSYDALGRTDGCWKVDASDLTDTRTLEIYAYTIDQSDPSAPVMNLVKEKVLNASYGEYSNVMDKLIMRFTAGGRDKTKDMLNHRDGWSLTDSFRALDAVQTEVIYQGYGYLDPSTGNILETQQAVLDANPGLRRPPNTEPYHFWRINYVDDHYHGETYPLSIETADGKITDGITIRFSADPLMSSWKNKPALIAQKGQISFQSTAKTVYVTSIEIVEGADLVRVEGSGGSRTISAIGKGRVVIRATDNNSNTVDEVLSIEAPELRATPAVSQVNVDGVPRIPPFYYAWAGKTLARGTDFDPALYDELLLPAVSVPADLNPSAPASAILRFLSSSAEGIFVSSFGGNALYETFRGNSWAHIPFQGRLTPRSSDVSPAAASLRLMFPFSSHLTAGTADIGELHDFTSFENLTGKAYTGTDGSLGASYTADEYVTLATYRDRKTTLSCNTADVFSDRSCLIGKVEAGSEYSGSSTALKTEVLQGGSVVCSFSTEPGVTHGAGTAAFYIGVKNRVSGEEMFHQSFGKVRIYLHGAIGARTYSRYQGYLYDYNAFGELLRPDMHAMYAPMAMAGDLSDYPALSYISSRHGPSDAPFAGIENPSATFGSKKKIPWFIKSDFSLFDKGKYKRYVVYGVSLPVMKYTWVDFMIASQPAGGRYSESQRFLHAADNETDRTFGFGNDNYRYEYIPTKHCYDRGIGDPSDKFRDKFYAEQCKVSPERIDKAIKDAHVFPLTFSTKYNSSVTIGSYNYKTVVYYPYEGKKDSSGKGYIILHRLSDVAPSTNGFIGHRTQK